MEKVRSLHPCTTSRSLVPFANQTARQVRHRLLQARRPAALLSSLYHSVRVSPQSPVHSANTYVASLPVASFAPAKHHRQAINRWNRFVLGDEYINQAAKLHSKTKE